VVRALRDLAALFRSFTAEGCAAQTALTRLMAADQRARQIPVQAVVKAYAGDPNEMLRMNEGVLEVGDKPLAKTILRPDAWVLEHARSCSCMDAFLEKLKLGLSREGWKPEEYRQARAIECMFYKLDKAIRCGIPL
jgi:hypothetical protein